MAGWPGDLVRIQQEEDGTFTYEIVELGEKGREVDADTVLDVVMSRLEVLEHHRPYPARLAEIGAKLEVIEAEMDALENERVALQAEAVQLEQEAIEPIQAVELLEQRDMAKRYMRYFLLDMPLEQHLGKPVVCISFKLYKDIDQDGDIDLAPVLSFKRVIKR